jgi:hypothetical protein
MRISDQALLILELWCYDVTGASNGHVLLSFLVHLEGICSMRVKEERILVVQILMLSIL